MKNERDIFTLRKSDTFKFKKPLNHGDLVGKDFIVITREHPLGFTKA
jgi:hypothetical protein